MERARWAIREASLSLYDVYLSLCRGEAPIEWLRPVRRRSRSMVQLALAHAQASKRAAADSSGVGNDLQRRARARKGRKEGRKGLLAR